MGHPAAVEWPPHAERLRDRCRRHDGDDDDHRHRGQHHRPGRAEQSRGDGRLEHAGQPHLAGQRRQRDRRRDLPGDGRGQHLRPDCHGRPERDGLRRYDGPASHVVQVPRASLQWRRSLEFLEHGERADATVRGAGVLAGPKIPSATAIDVVQA